jgi:hypothetical protein
VPARHSSGTSTWWIRPRALAILLGAGAVFGTAIWLPSRNDTAEASEPHTVFADEFDGQHGSGPDTAKWLLAGAPTTARQDGVGQLVLTRPMGTRVAFEEPFGHVDASVKVRRAADAVRAFALVDQRGQVVLGTGQGIDQEAVPTFGNDFHSYAVDWSPTSVVWSVDSRPILTSAKPDGPIALVLNLAADARQTSPMLVDFVRVTAFATPLPQPSDSAPTLAPTTTPTATAPTTTPTTKAPTTTPTTTAPTQPPTSKAPEPTPWTKFTTYKVGDLVTFKGVTYRVLEAHTALPGWEPPALPNLFAKV